MSLSIEKAMWIEEFMLDNFFCITTTDELVNYVCHLMNKEKPDFPIHPDELYEKLEEEDEERLSWILRNTFCF